MSSDLRPPSPRPLRRMPCTAARRSFLPDRPAASSPCFRILLHRSFAACTSCCSTPAPLPSRIFQGSYICLSLLLPLRADRIPRTRAWCSCRPGRFCTPRQGQPHQMIRRSARSIPARQRSVRAVSTKGKSDPCLPFSCSSFYAVIFVSDMCGTPRCA